VKRAIVCIAGLATMFAVFAGQGSAASTNQRFSINGSNSGGTVWASGAVSGTGRDIALKSGTTDKFVFAGGTIWVNHQATNQTQPSIDPRSCSGRISESGNYQLVKGSGMYRGISGSGTYSASGYVRQTRTASGCTGEPQSHYFVTASGWTTLP
jgi:hypothetical protein